MCLSLLVSSPNTRYRIETFQNVNLYPKWRKHLENQFIRSVPGRSKSGRWWSRRGRRRNYFWSWCLTRHWSWSRTRCRTWCGLGSRICCWLRCRSSVWRSWGQSWGWRWFWTGRWKWKGWFMFALFGLPTVLYSLDRCLCEKKASQLLQWMCRSSA